MRTTTRSTTADPRETTTRIRVVKFRATLSSWIPSLSRVVVAFSLKVSRRSLVGDRRFLFRRRYPSKRSNPRLDGPLSEPTPNDRAMRSDPGGHRASLNNDDGGGPKYSVPNSDGNSSLGPARAINSRTPRWKDEDLSADSTSPHEEDAVVEGSPLEYRGSARKEALEKNPWRSERAATAGRDARKRRYRFSREKKGSRGGSDVSPARKATHFEKGNGLSTLPGFGRRPRRFTKISREDRGSRDLASRRVERFGKDRNDDEGDRRSLVQSRSLAPYLRSIVVGVSRTLGMFVQIGRQIMDIVESNAALACTKEYLWLKIIRWIDA